MIELFKNLAASAEKRIGELAQGQAANLDRRKALDALEGRLDQMVADGKIDDHEREEIRARMSEAGVDPEEVDQLLRELDSAKGSSTAIADKLAGAIRRTRGYAEDDQATTNLELQFALEDYRNGIETASALLKNQHDAYMNVIKNLG